MALSDSDKTPDEQAKAAFDSLSVRYTGGDREVGKPAYDQGGVIAYNLKQAHIIFQNLLEAKLDGGIIPFIDIESNKGTCVKRRDAMMKHMMFHQQVAPEAIGVSVAFLKQGEPSMVDYVRRIKGVLKEQSPMPTHGAKMFDFHTAPTINVYSNGAITPFALDPSLCSDSVPHKKWAKEMRDAATYHYKWGTGEKLGGVILDSKGVKICEKEEYRIHDVKVIRPASAKKRLTEEGVQYSVADMEIVADTENELFQAGRAEHKSLAEDARTHGVGQLPNCGPLAFAGVDGQLAVKRFNKLPIEERRTRIKEVLLRHGTQRYSADPADIPLFERAAIKGSPKLKEEMLRLATEFVDLAIAREENIIRSDAGKVFKKAELESRISSEMLIWFRHSQQTLEQFPQVESAGALTGSMLRLAAITTCEVGHIDSKNIIGLIAGGGHDDNVVDQYLRGRGLDSHDDRKWQLAEQMIRQELEQLNGTESIAK